MYKIASIILLLCLTTTLLAQDRIEYYDNGKKMYEVKEKDTMTFKIWYYPNGKMQSKSTFNNNGAWIARKQWDEEGNLTEDRDLVKERKEREIEDISFINWQRKDTVEIQYIERDSTTQFYEIDSVQFLKFHYKSLDTNGYVFDSSFDRKEPMGMSFGFAFIKSLYDAISTLKEGDIVYIRVPPKYAFGNEGRAHIPPNTTLVFYVEMKAPIPYVKKGKSTQEYFKEH